MHVLSILLLVIGGLLALHSWGLFGRTFSYPLLGGLMLMVGLRLLPATSSWWWLGAVADPVWLLHLTLILFGILGMAHEWWSTRAFNRVHQFLGIRYGESDKHVIISLYKNQSWHIRYKFHPPQPTTGGALLESGGLTGVWQDVGADLVLKGYGESWSLTIYECDGAYLTSESCILGSDPWDSLDGIALNRA